MDMPCSNDPTYLVLINFYSAWSSKNLCGQISMHHQTQWLACGVYPFTGLDYWTDQCKLQLQGFFEEGSDHENKPICLHWHRDGEEGSTGAKSFLKEAESGNTACKLKHGIGMSVEPPFQFNGVHEILGIFMEMHVCSVFINNYVQQLSIMLVCNKFPVCHALVIDSCAGRLILISLHLLAPIH